MPANDDTPREGENVSENSSESESWESVGRDLLIQQIEGAEASFSESFQDAKAKLRRGEDLTRSDVAAMQQASVEIQEVIRVGERVTEPFVYEKEREGCN